MSAPDNIVESQRSVIWVSLLQDSAAITFQILMDSCAECCRERLVSSINKRFAL